MDSAVDELTDVAHQTDFTTSVVETVLDQLGVVPYDEEYKILTCEARKILVAGGERAGKSWTASLYATCRVPFGSLYWLVGPDYEQARPEFNYMVDQLGRLGAIDGARAVSAPRIGKASVRLKTGQLIETKSADEVTKLASVAPDGIIMCEAAQHSMESFYKCVGRIAEKRGWLILVGTFEGSEGWYPELYTEWSNPTNLDGGVTFSLPSWGNTIVYPGGFNDPEIQSLFNIYKRVPGLFEERIAAIPVAPRGLVFREFKRLVHVRPEVNFNPELPVYLAVDPSAGGNPYAVLACQFEKDAATAGSGDEIDYCNVIDEVYETDTICEQMIALCQQRSWWSKVAGGAIDIEAPDDLKRWLKIGKVALRTNKVPQLQGIRRLKTFLYYERTDEGELREPHLRIAPKVASLPYEFGKYRRRDTNDIDAVPKEEPPSAQPNHSIKALWYLLIARYGFVKARKKFSVVYNWHKQY